MQTRFGSSRPSFLPSVKYVCTQYATVVQAAGRDAGGSGSWHLQLRLSARDGPHSRGKTDIHVCIVHKPNIGAYCHWSAHQARVTLSLTHLCTYKHVKGAWEVERIPPVLLDRRVDVGDVSPDDARALVSALNSGAQGIQCDFDDGFCPTWRNVLLGIHNISQASRGALSYPDPATAQAVGIGATPGVMMLRPRAWCMTEMHLHVNGRAVPGPLVDFG